MLFSGFGSGVVELTIAVLEITPVASGLTVPLIMIILSAPAGNVPKLRNPGHGLNVTPPSIEYIGLRMELGMLSIKRTFSAALGPKLLTVIV